MTLELQLIKFAEFFLFACCLYWLLREFCINQRILAFRDRLFSIRHRLFLHAAAGTFRFDDPAYIEMRRFINQLIRTAHLYTPVKLAVILILRKSSQVRDRGEITTSVASVSDPEEKRILLEIQADVLAELVKFSTFGLVPVDRTSALRHVTELSDGETRWLEYTLFSASIVDGVEQTYFRAAEKP